MNEYEFIIFIFAVGALFLFLPWIGEKVGNMFKFLDHAYFDRFFK